MTVSSLRYQDSSPNEVQSPKPDVQSRANFGLWTWGGNDYVPLMALARILVDGYSLLNN